MPTVLEIATAHFTSQQSSSLGNVTVSQWLDGGNPVVLEVYRATQDDLTAIASAKARLGAAGAIVWTIIRRCRQSGVRVFADTDETTLMTSVSPVVLKSIYDGIVALD